MARVSSRRFVTLSARSPPDSSSLADGRQDSPTLLMGYGEGVLPPPVRSLSSRFETSCCMCTEWALGHVYM